MDEILVSNVLNVLKKSNDKNVIIKVLLKLRVDIVKDVKGIILFRDHGGIPPMVQLLNRPNEKILEIALSILGNCCTDQICCTQALENKILAPLLIILKGLSNPLIQCRACRLLGNLAKENQSQIVQYGATISQSLCMILDETTDIQTSLMGVRAAKFFLHDKLFRNNFLQCSGLRILLKILTRIVQNSDCVAASVDKNETNTCDKSSTPMINVAASSSDKSNENDQEKYHYHREEYFKEVVRNLEGVRSDVFDAQMVKIMSLQQQASKKFILPEDKTANDIISEILKSIQILSEHQMNRAIKEIYNFNSGMALSSVVFFIEEHDNIFRSIALKILSNFSEHLIAIPLLCSSDAIGAACRLITAKDLKLPLNETDTRCCIKIICKLSGDACNRAKIRVSGALKKLIVYAKTSSSYSEITMILFALRNFQYDHRSISLLLQEGLVDILIKELNAYVSTIDKYRKEEKAKRKRKAHETIKTNNKNPKPVFESSEPDSPSSSGSPSLSPCSSRSLSPVTKFINENYESDSYSPVGSDDESEKNAITASSGGNTFEEIMKLLDVNPFASKSENNVDEQQPDTDDDEDEKKQQNANANNFEDISSTTTAIDVIDCLLLRISLHIKHKNDLGRVEAIKSITQAKRVFSSNNFGQTLHNILIQSQFFTQIIKEDAIHHIYLLHKQESTSGYLLDPLTFVGESGYGEGELVRLLTKCEENIQKRASIAIAFIIRNPKILYQYLVKYDVLYTLMNIILNKNDEYSEEAADSITCLSNSLGIEIQKYNSKEFNEDEEFDESIYFRDSFDSMVTVTTNVKNIEKNDNDEQMKFILHRGCSRIPINFNKNLLIKCSDVFQSMLNGDYKEGNEGEIHLKNHTVNGIKYFLNLVELNSKSQLLNVPPIYHFESLLEAYELSRMYMIDKLEEKIFNMILFRLNAKTCLKTFEWSIRNYNPELSEIVINYYLSSELCGKEKVALFREADYCEYSKEWNNMITDAVLVKCQNLCSEIQ